MRLRTVLIILSLGIALFASALLGVVWAGQSFMALAGFREAGSYSREAEIAFIRSRVAHPLISPEWIKGEGDDLEWRWSKSEMKARATLPFLICIATACIVTVRLRRKCPTNAMEATAG
jgi:hypothetical protein